MENRLKLGIATGLALTVTVTTVLSATTATSAVGTVDIGTSIFHKSPDLTLAQFVIPDQVIPDPEPVDIIESEDGQRGDAPTESGPVAVVSIATPTVTDEIAVLLERGGELCEGTPEVYEIDCLSQNYRETAKKLSNRGDYGEARTVLLDTADQLDELVQTNRDRTKPRINVKDKPDGRKLNKRPLTPVKPESVARVKRQAVPILEEASTKLLRSASASSTKSVHYQRIAAAVSSNKVLLRSG